MRFLLLGLALLVSGCADAIPPSPSRALGPGERWLPVANFDHGRLLCAGGGPIGDVRLHGSVNDPRLAWTIDPTGKRTELGWRLGYSARFTPALEVLDDHSVVVAQEGSRVTGSCPTADQGVRLGDFGTPGR